MRVGSHHHTPAALLQEKKQGPHCIGGWVGPRAGWGGCGQPCPYRTAMSVAGRHTDRAMHPHDGRRYIVLLKILLRLFDTKYYSLREYNTSPRHGFQFQTYFLLFSDIYTRANDGSVYFGII